MGGCNNYQLSDRQIDRQTYTNGDEMTDGWIVRLGGWGGGATKDDREMEPGSGGMAMEVEMGSSIVQE